MRGFTAVVVYETDGVTRRDVEIDDNRHSRDEPADE